MSVCIYWKAEGEKKKVKLSYMILFMNYLYNLDNK